MEVLLQLQVPDDIVERLRARSGDLSRRALESMAADGYRDGVLTSAEVRRMLGELRGLPVLQGARGTAPASLDAVAGAIAALGEAALALDGTLRALEVNPLWVNGDQVEALDVLVITEAREQQ